MGILRFIFKLASGLIGLVFAVVGAVALVFMVMVFVPDSSLASQSLGQVWFRHDPFLALLHNPSIQLAQVVVERKLNLPSLWNPGITTLLNWPSWMALMVTGLGGLVIGAFFWRLARPRPKRA